MNDKTLELIGRKHTSSDIIDVYHMAKKYWISSYKYGPYSWTSSRRSRRKLGQL